MRVVVFALVAWVIVCAAVAGIIAPKQINTGFKDSAALLAFISLTAVAIERCIEGFFTLLAGRLGEWWPLKTIRDEFNTFEKQTNDVLNPVVKGTIDALTAAQKGAGTTADQIAALQGLIDKVNAEATRLRTQYNAVTTKLAPGSDRLARVGEINTAMTAVLHDVHDASAQCTTKAREDLQKASDIANDASLIISSFSDNPARRAASLALGASLGMLVAGAVGLNLFVATLAGPNDSSADLPAVLAGWLGVVLTGVVIGLGSAPTHEVVKSLQAYKESRSAPVDVVTLATGPAAAAAVIQEAALPGGPDRGTLPGVPRVYLVRQVRRSN